MREVVTVKKGAVFGITEKEVHAAMDKLFPRLKVKPSIKAIRGETGRGSDTTIARHAKTWKPKDDPEYIVPESEKADPELEATFQAAVERRVLKTTEQLETELRVTKEDRDTLEEEGSRQGALIETLQAEVERLTANEHGKKGQIEQLEQNLAATKGELVVERNSAAQLLTQLGQAQAEAKSATEQMARIEQALADLQKELKSTKVALDSEKVRSSTLSEQLATAQALAEQIPKLQEEVRDITKLRADLLQVSGKLSRSEGIIEELRSVAVAERAISDDLRSELATVKVRVQPDYIRIVDFIEAAYSRAQKNTLELETAEK